jgi:hypothetical protein
VQPTALLSGSKRVANRNEACGRAGDSKAGRLQLTSFTAVKARKVDGPRHTRRDSFALLLC